MSRNRYPAIIALPVVLALVAASCGGGGSKEPGQASTKGGIFRIETDGFEWTAGLDPTAEYLGFAFEFFNAIHRPLLQYNHKSGAKGGNKVIADSATDTGQVSTDGLTWTFKIKKGIKFSPPVNREVTSADFVTSILRSADPALGAGGPGFYYDVIQGYTDVRDKKATSISGISTPDPSTIVFKLTKPAGDFGNRLALPTAAPMPKEVTDCFKDKQAEYGRFQISTGPYMIEGSQALKGITVAGDKVTVDCAALKATPLAGFDPDNHLRIVRNPNYDAATDSKEARSNNIDGVTLTKNTNTADIFQRIESGLADGESAQPPATVIKKGETDPAFKDNFHSDPGDRTWYLYLKMTDPPFDDLAVRRAVNFVLDREAMRLSRGGKLGGELAEHMITPDVLGGLLKQGEFDPYNVGKFPAGDVESAKAEMKKSKYDTNKDGMCDAPQCKGILNLTRNTPPFTDQAPIIEQSLAKIGLEIKTNQVATFYKTVQVPTQASPIGSGAGWGKDYADASTYFEPLLVSSTISKENTTNYSLLGLTSAQAADIGLKYPAGGVPSIDEDVKKCAALLDTARQQCWADLDKKTTAEIVPWVPYLWANALSVVSDAVVSYEFDQFATEVSFVHIAIDKSKQK